MLTTFSHTVSGLSDGIGKCSSSNFQAQRLLVRGLADQLLRTVMMPLHSGFHLAQLLATTKRTMPDASHLRYLASMQNFFAACCARGFLTGPCALRAHYLM